MKYGPLPLKIYPDEGDEYVTTVADFMISSIESEESLKLRTPILQEIFQTISLHLKSGEEYDSRILTHHMNPMISSLVADILSREYILSTLWNKKESFVETEKEKLNELVPETFLFLKLNRVHLLLHELEQKMKEPDFNSEEFVRVMTLFNKLSTLKPILSKKLGGRTLY
ncbi:MAG: hypothetical protein K9I34_04160 [Bacteroidales bacterium]|nr:hypothetical protein [Bacteroidales bacterium]